MDGRRMPEQMIFYPAGKSLLVILFMTQRGRYSATNGRLVGEFGGQIGLDGTFDPRRLVLSLTDALADELNRRSFVSFCSPLG